MAKNPYKVLTRPHTKKADIIRATLPGAHDVNHVYATCSTREQATELCRLLNLGLELDMQEKVSKIGEAIKPRRKPRGRSK